MKHNIKKETLLDLYHNKKTPMWKIAKILKVGVGTVHRHIHSEGIEPLKYDKAWNSGVSCKDDSRILSGIRHPRWKDASKYYIDYKIIKKRLMPCECSFCHNDAKLLHHKDKNTNNNDESNLIPLCGSCHTILHNKERKSYLKLLEGQKRAKDRKPFKNGEKDWTRGNDVY